MEHPKSDVIRLIIILLMIIVIMMMMIIMIMMRGLPEWIEHPDVHYFDDDYCDNYGEHLDDDDNDHDDHGDYDEDDEDHLYCQPQSPGGLLRPIDKAKVNSRVVRSCRSNA